HAVEVGLPGRDDGGVRRPERILLDGGPVPAAPVDSVRAHLHEGAADGHGCAEDAVQNLARDGAGGDAARRLARRRAAAAGIVADAVLGPVGVVGVAGPELVLDGGVVLGTLVLVLDQKADRRPRRLALEQARQDLHLIRLAPLRREARLPGPAAVEPGLDVGFAQREARRHAVDDAADRRPMTLTPGRESKELTEAVERHLTSSGRNPAAARRLRAPIPCAACRRYDSRCRRDALPR